MEEPNVAPIIVVALSARRVILSLSDYNQRSSTANMSPDLTGSLRQLEEFREL